MDRSLPQQRPRYELVHFDGDELIAVILEGEGVATPLRVVCGFLGLDPEAQRRRLQEHDVLSQGLRVVKVPLGERMSTTLAILHRYLPFWLATISPSQVAEAARPKLVRYQREVADVLAALYVGGLAQAAPGAGAPTDAETRVAALQARLADAVAELRLARETLLAAQTELSSLREAQENMGQVVDQHGRQLGELGGLMDDLQERLASYTTITAAQQQVIKSSIQRIAARYKRRHDTDIFARLFAEFTRALRVPKYSMVPAGQYEAAIEWVRQAAAHYLPDDPDALPPVQEALL